MTWDRNFRGTIINSVTVLFDYDLFSGKYLSTMTVPHSSSIASFGEFPLVISSQGLRSSSAGTTELINAVIAVIFGRYAHGAPTLAVRTFLSKHLLEPGDVVSLTSALIPNPATKTRGITNALMEVLSRGVIADQGYVDLQLIWPGWSN